MSKKINIAIVGLGFGAEFIPIYQRHPKKVAARKAIVAVARKLTTRIYAVLKQQRPFVLRPDSSSAPLTAEETAGPRGRLDAAQNEQP